MAKPGPAPKPTALKKLAGNPGDHRLNDREPQPERRMPKMPRGLPLEAKRFWKDNAERLLEMGVLTEVDGPALALTAIHYAIALRAAREIDEEDKGLTTKDERKLIRKSPLMQVLRDNSSSFRMFAAEFGLTPASRSRLKVEKPDRELSLAEQLFQMTKD